MRLPRRVPWKSFSELEQVFSWVFSPEADDTTKQLALNRLASWRAITQIPHAIESTWMILSVVLEDSALSARTSGSLASVTNLRQSYSMAIIRLVNGLVDPLQQGVYARPITTIASQIGLPIWLVELRHAATHEDLPSLALLRDAAHESLTWLLNNYWLPTVAPANLEDAPPPVIPPVLPLLKEYRSLMKSIARDASIKGVKKGDIARMHRDLERWVGETKVSYGMDSGQMGMDDEGEKFAIEKLCEELVESGYLVSISKKSKAPPPTLTYPNGPPTLMAWEGLLNHVQSNHVSFGERFITQLVAHLISSEGEAVEDGALLSWIEWAISTWKAVSPECSAESVAYSLLKELPDSDINDETFRTRIELILSNLPLEATDRAKYSLLISAMSQQSASSETLSLDDMEQRIMILRKAMNNAPMPQLGDDRMVVDPPIDRDTNPAPGIRLLGPETGWKPCPIGYNGLTMKIA
ncbi:Las1-domain-containing protein [Clavulina sp. PMI_390]|nr:Las1-domain-containing protein [Clavulina sp. PMI_390]